MVKWKLLISKIGENERKTDQGKFDDKSEIEKPATCVSNKNTAGGRLQIFPVRHCLSTAVSVRNACYKWMVTSDTQGRRGSIPVSTVL